MVFLKNSEDECTVNNRSLNLCPTFQEVTWTLLMFPSCA